MAKESYELALTYVLVHEGGYVNDADDAGGPTNKGITQGVYDAKRRKNGQQPRPVRAITAAEVAEIYHDQYWVPIRGDALPVGLDYVVFDYGVNSGTGRAIKDLQKTLGVKADGVIGEMTLAAVAEREVVELIEAYIARRMKFLQSIKARKGQGGWPKFGRGWTRRVLGEAPDMSGNPGDTGVIDRAVAMIIDKPLPPPARPAPGKALEPKREVVESTTLQSVVLDGVAKLGAGAAALSAIDDRWVQLGVVALLGVAMISSVVIFRERLRAWADGWQ